MGILAGKKTYVVGVIGIIGAIASYLVGDATVTQAGQAILTALLGMTIRHGVANS